MVADCFSQAAPKAVAPPPALAANLAAVAVKELHRSSLASLAAPVAHLCTAMEAARPSPSLRTNRSQAGKQVVLLAARFMAHRESWHVDL